MGWVWVGVLFVVFCLFVCLFCVRIMVLKPNQTKQTPKSQTWNFVYVFLAVVLHCDMIMVSFLAHAESIHSAVLPAGKYPWDWDTVPKNSQLCGVYVIYAFYAILLSNGRSWFWKEWNRKCSSILSCSVKYCNYVFQFFTSLWIYMSKYPFFEGFCLSGSVTDSEYFLWSHILQWNVSITRKFTGLISLIWLRR